MTDQLSPVDDEIAAIKAIAGTRNGILLHRYLRRILEAVVDIPDSGALLSQNGRRSLARDLMRHMAEGLHDDRSTGSSSDRPILARASSGVAVTGRTGPRRDRSRLPRVDSFADTLNADGTEPGGSTDKA